MIDHEPNGAKRLTPEERAAIPAMYAALGSKEAVADAIGCKVESIQRWLDKITGEEWDRIYVLQRPVIVQKATEIVYKALDVLDKRINDGDVRVGELVNAIRTLSERIAVLGGVGGIQGSDQPTNELQAFLAAGETNRRQAAIEAALATGSLEPLKAFAPVASPLGEVADRR